MYVQGCPDYVVFFLPVCKLSLVVLVFMYLVPYFSTGVSSTVIRTKRKQIYFSFTILKIIELNQF